MFLECGVEQRRVKAGELVLHPLVEINVRRDRDVRIVRDLVTLLRQDVDDQILRTLAIREAEPDRELELIGVVEKSQRRQRGATILELDLLRIDLRDKELRATLDVR